MADKRAFAQFDVGYLDNPKIMDVFDASPIAVCMHFASVLYCAQHLTDGVVASGPMSRKVGASSSDVKLLIDAGLWHVTGHDCPYCPEVAEGKVFVHDYPEHNRTSEGVKRSSEAGKKGAAARWNKENDTHVTRADRMRLVSDPQCENEEIAMAREKERKKELKDLSSTPDEYDQWYSRYPRKEAREAGRKAFIKARKTVSLETLTAGLEQYIKTTSGMERKFIALPASWLNAGRWADEVDMPAVVNSPWSKDFHQTGTK
jgi:hypothetical protein